VVLIYNSSETGLSVWLRNAINNDDDLQEDIKGVYNIRAKKDADLPYIVYRVDIDTTQKAIQRGVIFFGLWDYSQTEERILRMKGNLVKLLDRRKVCFPESSLCRFFYSTGSYIPEDTENIWHREEMFDFSFDRKVEIDNIIARSENNG